MSVFERSVCDLTASSADKSQKEDSDTKSAFINYDATSEIQTYWRLKETLIQYDNTKTCLNFRDKASFFLSFFLF